MKTLRGIFWFLIGFAIVALALPAFAAEAPKVPYTKSTENLCGVGMSYNFDNGQPASPALADEVVLRLVNCNGPELRDGNDKLVPQRVEIREFVPEAVSPQRMPLLRVMWDADNDGIADFIAIVTGYRDGEPEFRIFPIDSRERRPMAEQGWFKVTIPPMKEA
jgi:hypothetical protein